LGRDFIPGERNKHEFYICGCWQNNRPPAPSKGDGLLLYFNKPPNDDTTIIVFSLPVQGRICDHQNMRKNAPTPAITARPHHTTTGPVRKSMFARSDNTFGFDSDHIRNQPHNRSHESKR
jgi:hypothetical protein